jgi:predicted ATPase
MDSKDRWFDLAFAPDGLKAYFLLMTALLTPGPLIAVEEPESHLVPRALDLVAGQFVAAAESGEQVIVTTQSPLLAQHIPPDAIRVLSGGRFERPPATVRENRRVFEAWLTNGLHESGAAR